MNRPGSFSAGAAWRAIIPSVNDGIIGTAGVIEGFLAAGAGASALVTASIAATAAGAGSIAGLKYSEVAAERDAEAVAVHEEASELGQDPDQELKELAAFYEDRGVDSHVALEVARQISEHDALSAQLEAEHGIRDLTPPLAPLINALKAGAGFAAGAALPIVIAVAAPAHLRGVATVIAVLVSLSITAAVTARVSGSSVRRTVVRAMVVGGVAMGLALVVGHFLPDPDGPAVGTEQDYLPGSP